MPSRCETLVKEILEHARAHGLTVCTAESCSAGRLAMLFGRTEGASLAFQGGIVAYTKDAKMRLLSVPVEALREGTAVCAVVAEAMALGAVKKSGATLGVSITGVAGPEPDEDGNPVGLVYCGAARSDGSTRNIKLELGAKHPDTIVDEACAASLILLKNLAFS